jgi:hypothetical protein
LEDLVRGSPRRAGLSRSRWWLDGLRQAVEWLRDCTLAGVQQILKRFGLGYKRGREYLHSPDREYDLKLAYIEAATGLAQTQPHKYVLLYQDELTYYRRPTIARGYAPIGSKEPRAVIGYSSNKKRRIAGCLDVVSGQFHAWQRASFGSRTLVRFFQAVADAYPDAEVIFVVMDNWPPHFHPQVLEAFAANRMVPLRLPTYAPWTNPVEKVWKRLKQEILHLHDFEDDWCGLQHAVQCWLNRWLHGSLDLLHSVGLYPY